MELEAASWDWAVGSFLTFPVESGRAGPALTQPLAPQHMHPFA